MLHAVKADVAKFALLDVRVCLFNRKRESERERERESKRRERESIRLTLPEGLYRTFLITSFINYSWGHAVEGWTR
jgi:hypothetical protein